MTISRDMPHPNVNYKHPPSIQVLANAALTTREVVRKYNAIEDTRVLTLDEKQDLMMHKQKFYGCLNWAIEKCASVDEFYLIQTIVGPRTIMEILKKSVEDGRRELYSA